MFAFISFFSKLENDITLLKILNKLHACQSQESQKRLRARSKFYLFLKCCRNDFRRHEIPPSLSLILTYTDVVTFLPCKSKPGYHNCYYDSCSYEFAKGKASLDQPGYHGPKYQTLIEFTWPNLQRHIQ